MTSPYIAVPPGSNAQEDAAAARGVRFRVVLERSVLACASRRVPPDTKNPGSIYARIALTGDAPSPVRTVNLQTLPDYRREYLDTPGFVRYRRFIAQL